MICPRYIVFDDAPQHRRFGWTADQFADALRSPLAAIGVLPIRSLTSPLDPITSSRWRSPQANFNIDCERHQGKHPNLLNEVGWSEQFYTDFLI
jgi:hypothetical protein